MWTVVVFCSARLHLRQCRAIPAVLLVLARLVTVMTYIPNFLAVILYIMLNSIFIVS